MRENSFEVLTGLAVVLVAGGFLLYAAQATGYGGPSEGLRLTASFRSIEGVSLGTDVRLAGVKIGAVTDLALDPQTYRATTELTVDAAVPIPDDSSAVVASEGSSAEPSSRSSREAPSPTWPMAARSWTHKAL